MQHIFIELSFVLLIATVVAGLMQFFKQPLIIGHIVTGLLVGPYFLDLIHSNETIEIFSQLGIALLIFIIGLSLSPRVIKEVGKVSLITGIGQVLFTSLIGFVISRAIGFTLVASAYISIALTFSSTIIILKLLSDKKDLGRLYGRIATGFLLVQDIIAMIILIATTSLSQDKDLLTLAIESVLKGSGLLALLFFVTIFVLPKLTSFFARSQEFLFIFAISWGLGVAALFQLSGFSIEIGALFAGIVLANSPYSLEISARMRPLRDFFIVLFFIMLGAQMQIENISNLILPAIIFSLFILIGNPIIVMALMGYLGYNKKTSFKAGLTVAQISEFSLILVVLGHRVGHLSPDIVSLVTAVGLITIAASTYYILYSDKLYEYLAPYLSIFERKNRTKETMPQEEHDIILIGFDSVGHDFIDSFKKLKSRFLVVDYNPEIIDKLTEQGINCRYGDADDNELLEELGLEKAKMVISTITDFKVNALILGHVRRVNRRAVVILKSDQISEAAELYSKGASYVMMPHYLGGEHTCTLISKHGFDLSEFTKERARHRKYLEKRQGTVLN